MIFADGLECVVEATVLVLEVCPCFVACLRPFRGAGAMCLHCGGRFVARSRRRSLSKVPRQLLYLAWRKFLSSGGLLWSKY